MAVRNFYVEANIDGRSTKLAGGPAAKDGEMVINLYQRDKGEIVTAFKLLCKERDGNLVTSIINNSGKEICSFGTMR